MSDSALFLSPHYKTTPALSPQVLKPQAQYPVKREESQISIFSKLSVHTKQLALLRGKHTEEKTEEEKRVSPRQVSTFIEVTFLNKLVRVHLDGLTSFEDGSDSMGVSLLTQRKEQQNTKASKVKRLVALLVKHFGIKLDFMSSCHLFDIEVKNVVWADSDLREGECYFLFFVRSGFHLSRQAVKKSQLEGTPLTSLFKKPLFHREGRDFRIQQTNSYEGGWVEELFINESRKNLQGFHCPILQCGKNFQKSCDLTFHFNIETGNKPFSCLKCKRQFRRISALNRHLVSCVGSKELRRSHLLRMSETQQASPPKQEPLFDIALLKPSLFQKELFNRRQACEGCFTRQQSWRDNTQSKKYEDVLLSYTCSQLLKNWSAHWHVNQLLTRGEDERQLLAARVKMCLQIYATSQILRNIMPQPSLRRVKSYY